MTLPGLFRDMYTGKCLLLWMTVGISVFWGGKILLISYTHGSVDMVYLFLMLPKTIIFGLELPILLVC